jgi:hypothetical protein
LAVRTFSHTKSAAFQLSPKPGSSLLELKRAL